MTKRVVECALKAGLSAHLRYTFYGRSGHGTGDCRNSHGQKMVQSETAQFDIDVPRDRDGSFAPQLVQKRQQRLDSFDDKGLRCIPVDPPPP